MIPDIAEWQASHESHRLRHHGEEMIILPASTHPQGSGMWIKARLGIPTASEFDKIIQPVSGDLSKSADKYLCRLAHEMLSRQPAQDLEGLDHIERGKTLEPIAAKAYEFETGNKTEEVGLILSDDREIGASPDRLVNKREGAIEFKCPSGQIHLYYLRNYLIKDEASQYKPQRQGQLMVGEFSWGEFMSYHPHYPRVLVRTERDEKYINRLRLALKEFVDMKHHFIELIKAQGFVYTPKPIYDVAEKELAEKIMENNANVARRISEDYVDPV